MLIASKLVNVASELAVALVTLPPIMSGAGTRDHMLIWVIPSASLAAVLTEDPAA